MFISVKRYRELAKTASNYKKKTHQLPQFMWNYTQSYQPIKSNAKAYESKGQCFLSLMFYMCKTDDPI